MGKTNLSHFRVYKDGELIIADGTMKQCAEAIGVSRNTFKAAVFRSEHVNNPKWKIERLTPKRKGKPMHLYSVWNNYTDEIVIIDGTIFQCAEAMGITPSSFYSIVSRAEDGHHHKWHIEVSGKEERP